MTPEIVQFLVDSARVAAEAGVDPALVPAIIGACALLIATILTGFFKLWEHHKTLQEKQDKTYDLVNGRMQEVLKLTKLLAKKIGVEEGIEIGMQKERDRERDRIKDDQRESRSLE